MGVLKTGDSYKGATIVLQVINTKTGLVEERL